MGVSVQAERHGLQLVHVPRGGGHHAADPAAGGRVAAAASGDLLLRGGGGRRGHLHAAGDLRTLPARDHRRHGGHGRTARRPHATPRELTRCTLSLYHLVLLFHGKRNSRFVVGIDSKAFGASMHAPKIGTMNI